MKEIDKEIQLISEDPTSAANLSELQAWKSFAEFEATRLAQEELGKCSAEALDEFEDNCWENAEKLIKLAGAGDSRAATLLGQVATYLTSQLSVLQTKNPATFKKFVQSSPVYPILVTKRPKLLGLPTAKAVLASIPLGERATPESLCELQLSLTGGSRFLPTALKLYYYIFEIRSRFRFLEKDHPYALIILEKLRPFEFQLGQKASALPPFSNDSLVIQKWWQFGKTLLVEFLQESDHTGGEVQAYCRRLEKARVEEIAPDLKGEWDSFFQNALEAVPSLDDLVGAAPLEKGGSVIRNKIDTGMERAFETLARNFPS